MEELAHELFLGLLQYGEDESHTALSLVSTAFGERMAALKRTADFANGQLVLADGSFPIVDIALDRMKAASIRFPALEDVSVNLWNTLIDSNGWTDDRRATILAKLCTFTFVTELTLFNNDIAVVPDDLRLKMIGELTNLKNLFLTHNKIASLPDSICQLAALEGLYLGENNITTLPPSIGSLTALTTLDLDYNRIATLPTTIGQLTGLDSLELNDNQLTSTIENALPDSIGQLKGLTTLHVDTNQLSALPESIGGMTALTDLSLGDNKLTSTIENALPESIGGMTALTTLCLTTNQLTSTIENALPESIGGMTALTTLDLGDNQLTSTIENALPDAIGSLTALTTLDLRSNHIGTLPDSIVALTNIKRLWLAENPPFILYVQSRAVKAWLKGLKGSRTCNVYMD